MLKCLEIARPDSCWNKAQDGELVFVLLERDASAARAVRTWCSDRLSRGLNQPNDPQIQEALNWAETAERTHTRPERVASLKGMAWPKEKDTKPNGG